MSTANTSARRSGLFSRLRAWWLAADRNPVIWTLGAVLLTFFGWATFFTLDVASYASGQVIPAGQLKRIQHLEGGIIREIKVQEGQQVAAGDVMVELESVSAEAEVGDIKTRIGSLDIKALRVQASIARANHLNFPPTLEKAFPSFARDALEEFRSDKNRYEAGIQGFNTRMASRRAEIQEARERLAGLKKRAQLMAEQIRISEGLLQKKLTSEYEHLQLKREQEQILADRDTAVASEIRATRQLEEEQANLQTFRTDEEVKLRKTLQETTTELASLKEKVRKSSDSEDRTTVRSPVAGTVQTLYFKNRGAVVSPGGTIATLVPEGEELLIEAKLQLADVGYVHVGARARLSLASAVSGYSTINGEVVHISPDSVLDEKTGQSHYVVRVKPLELFFKRGNSELYALRPGVAVTCAILTGERTVLAVLLEPFLGSGVRPLTER